MKEKRKSPTGTTPYGYKRQEGFLVEDLPEQDIISEMLRLREEKNYSLRKIADYLNGNFIPSKQSSIWYSNVVGDIVGRETSVTIENNQEDLICLSRGEQ